MTLPEYTPSGQTAQGATDVRRRASRRHDAARNHAHESRTEGATDRAAGMVPAEREQETNMPFTLPEYTPLTRTVPVQNWGDMGLAGMGFYDYAPSETVVELTSAGKEILGPWAWVASPPQFTNLISQIDTPEELAYLRAKFDAGKIPHAEELSYQLAGFSDQRNVENWLKQQRGETLSSLEMMLVDNPGMAGQAALRPDIPDVYQGVADPRAADGGPAKLQALYDKYGVTSSDYSAAATNWALNNSAAAQAARDTDDGFGDLLQIAAIGAGLYFGLPALFGEGALGAGTLGAIGGTEATALAAADMAAGLLPASELVAMDIFPAAAGFGSSALGSIGGIDTLALSAADQAAGLLSAEALSTGATVLPVDLSTVVGTDLPVLDTIVTGANEMSVWDDIANEVFESVTSGAGETLSNTAVEEYLNSFPGMEQLYGSGDVTDLVTTLSNATGDLDLANSIATSFGDSAGTINQLLSGLQGDNLTKAVNAIKTVAGTGGAGSLLGNGSIKSVLSGLMGLYGAQNQSQDLTEAAKYLTENANPYRGYIQNGTVGGPGSVTSFMQGFQQPANQMASASGGYNDLLKTSYTDPLSIWNSPEMSALNNIFKQQIDRRDSVAGRNSQYGARAVEMQNNFLTNALPKYRTGLNEALTATSNAATNFGKVATPPGTGEAPASVGNLLQGAATAGNNYDSLGTVLNNLFS